MDILPLLDRCIAIERAVAEIYDAFAARTVSDSELRELWSALAQDERQHAGKLASWRELVVGEDAGHRTAAEGFEDAVREAEALLIAARERIPEVRTPDDAFAIALELEMSEIDAIYTALLQSSPLARYPDIAETRRREVDPHHEALVRAVRARSRDDQNLTRAALIALKD
jgi:rubrerythrin